MDDFEGCGDEDGAPHASALCEGGRGDGSLATSKPPLDDGRVEVEVPVPAQLVHEAAEESCAELSSDGGGCVSPAAAAEAARARARAAARRRRAVRAARAARERAAEDRARERADATGMAGVVEVATVETETESEVSGVLDDDGGASTACSAGVCPSLFRALTRVGVQAQEAVRMLKEYQEYQEFQRAVPGNSRS